MFLSNFRVKAGNVSDGACRLSGQSLVFGLEKPIAELESRIGVTPLLDLRLCAERNEPTSNTLLSACDEGICTNVIGGITKPWHTVTKQLDAMHAPPVLVHL